MTTTGVAGEIMDIAVERCRAGDSKQALAMFDAIRAQLDPPPAILKLIGELEATGCNRAAIASGGSLRVQATTGWDSNVSQGISARSLVLGTGDNAVELPLAPSYLPRASAFAQATADYSMDIPRYGLNVQVAAGQRVNRQASEYDLRTVSSAIAREFQLPIGNLRAQVDVSQIWLGGHHYQRTESAALQWLHTLPQGAWLATTSLTGIDYVTQPTQNARVWDTGVLREWQLDPAKSVHVHFSIQDDRARSTRPGGDRFGFQAEAGAVVLTQGWRLRPQVGYSWWNSEDVFAPGLLDVRRRNRLRQAFIQAERPLSPDTSLVLEWRGRWARDTISLYKYQAQVVSATLAFRF